MSTQQPGRQPASVYRRRRIVVGLAVLAVIVVIVLLFIPRGSAEDDTKPTGGTSESPKPGDSETPDADGSAACDPAVVTLTAVTDKESYQAGETPMISMKIVNSGAAACTFDVGTDAQRYEIVSGSDPIWNSADCQSDAQPQQAVLEPGKELTTTPFAWGRVRSAPDNCGDDRPQVTAGGATYRLSVSLGDAKSAEDTPFLLY
jgi:hypothetical protein